MARLFQQSEATAARRRFPVYLVDATDGLTPETGESAGQPQISKNGAAFGNTSATLTAVANGHYYVELTAAELDTLGTFTIRYKSAATAEFNMDGQVVAFDPYDAVRLGQTALPNAAADAAGGLPISDAGGLDMDAILVDTNALNDTKVPDTISLANINTQVDTALSDYDAPTRAEATSDKNEIITDLDDIKGTAFAKDTHSLVNIEGYADLIDDGTSGLAKIATDVAAILVDTGTTLPATLATINGYVDLIDDGTSGLAKIATDVAAVLVDTNALNDTKIPDTLSLAAINAQVDTAIETYHLDHLLAVDYDPASKPGVATALLNELVENDGGVSRFTSNALEQAPSGSGGDATAANQTTILNRLGGWTGSGDNTILGAFKAIADKAATGCTDIVVGNFDPATDANEALRDRGDTSWLSGSASIVVAPLTSALLTAAFSDFGANEVHISIGENATGDFVFTITDANGDAVDLSGKTLRFVIHDDSKGLFKLTATAGGADNNQVTVSVTATETANALKAEYKLWNVTDANILASGRFEVKNAPIDV